MAPDSFSKITFCEYLGSRCLESVGSGRLEECKQSCFTSLSFKTPVGFFLKYIKAHMGQKGRGNREGYMLGDKIKPRKSLPL